jgi:hypothetical protein
MILREKPLFVIRKPHEEITEEDVWAAFQQLILRSPCENHDIMAVVAGRHVTWLRRLGGWDDPFII